MPFYFRFLNSLILLLAICFITACNSENNTQKKSPPLPSQLEQKGGSLDALSKDIVAKMEEVMGGREAYDAIEHLQWNFFGSRKWWWNKWTGDVRCESLKSDISIVMNIQTQQGQVKLDGLIQTHQDSLSKYLERGYRWWINDSYWLVMPFKLNDPGISIQHVGTRITETDSIKADVLRLTFDDVGVTPSNMYDLYVDPSSKLLVQWDYYRTNKDSLPAFKRPWLKYESHKGVLFSTERGGIKIDDIKAYDKISEAIYSDLSRTGEEILSTEK